MERTYSENRRDDQEQQLNCAGPCTYFDDWMEEREKEEKACKELRKKREELIKFLSGITLADGVDPKEEEIEAIRVCYDQMWKCRKMTNDRVQRRGKEKQRRRRNFSEEEQKVLRQYGNKPSEKELNGLTSKLGCERKDILKHFNNKRYQESKRRRVNSELITEDEINNFLNGLDDCGKKT